MTIDPLSKLTPTRQDHGLSHDVVGGVERAVFALTHVRDSDDPPVMHVHEAAEVGIVTAGTVMIDFGDYVMTCGPGDVWLCAMWEPHARTVEQGGAEDVVAIFVPEFVAEEMPGVPSWLSVFGMPPRSRPCLVTDDAREVALGIGRDLRREVDRHSPEWPRIVRLGLLRLLIELSRSPAASASEHGTTEAAVRPTLVSRVMPALALVHEDPRRRVPVAQAAGACGLSRSRFQHTFRAAMGTSFGRFAQRVRLTFCAHLLLTTDASTEAIALEAGFASAGHLNRGFVKHYGMTASKFRSRGMPPGRGTYAGREATSSLHQRASGRI